MNGSPVMYERTLSAPSSRACPRLMTIWRKRHEMGVRRKPERLGHGTRVQKTVDKLEVVDTKYGKAYRSKKGFTVAVSKHS